jgi:hypothetical protein
MSDHNTQPQTCHCHDCTQARWLMDVRSQWMTIQRPFPQDVTSPVPVQQLGPDSEHPPKQS